MLRSAEHSSQENIWLLRFSVSDKPGAMVFAVDTRNIVEVVETMELEPLPASYHPFLGLFSHRDCPVPVFDLASVLRQPDGLGMAAKRTVICEVESGYVAFTIARTYGIQSTRASDILPVPAGLAAKTDQLKGVLAMEGGYTYVLLLRELLKSVLN